MLAASSNALSIIFILIFAAIQVFVYLLCVSKINDIKNGDSDPRLKLLENEDNLFDMNLYIGIAGTRPHARHHGHDQKLRPHRVRRLRLQHFRHPLRCRRENFPRTKPVKACCWRRRTAKVTRSPKPKIRFHCHE